MSIELLDLIDKEKDYTNITFKELCKIKGIGKAKSLMILSLFELISRLQKKEVTLNKLNDPVKVYNLLLPEIIHLKQEHFFCLYLNSKCNLIETKLLFMGTVNKIIVHSREIFKYAVKLSATFIIIVHNHPSNDVTPSKEDLDMTKNLVESSKIIGIEIIDHIIVSNKNYFSFSENNLIK